MKHILLVLFVTLTFACANRPAPSAPAAARQLEGAIGDGDRAALENLVADDFLWVRGSGETGDKQAFIAVLTGEAIDIAPFTAQQVRWFENGSLAMQSGVNVLKGTSSGQVFVDRHRFADLWRWRDGRWQLVYAQVTALPNND